MTLDAAYAANPAASGTTRPPPEAPDRSMDQRPLTRSTHQIRVRNCLTGLDMFR